MSPTKPSAEEMGQALQSLGCGLLLLGFFVMLGLAIVGMFLSAMLRG